MALCGAGIDANLSRKLHVLDAARCPSTSRSTTRFIVYTSNRHRWTNTWKPSVRNLEDTRLHSVALLAAARVCHLVLRSRTTGGSSGKQVRFAAAGEQRRRSLPLAGHSTRRLLFFIRGCCSCSRLGWQPFFWCCTLETVPQMLRRRRHTPPSVTLDRMLREGPRAHWTVHELAPVALPIVTSAVVVGGGSRATPSMLT